MQHLVQMLSLMMPHSQARRYEKVYYIMRLSGDSRERRLVWDFIVVRVWGWGEGSHTQPELGGLNFLLVPKEGATQTFLQFAQMCGRG